MCRKAAGEENSRFFSRRVTRSAARRPAAGLRGHPLAAKVGEAAEHAVDLAFGVGVLDGEFAGAAGAETGGAVGVGDGGLQASDDGLLAGRLVGVDTTGELLIVDELQQRGVRLGVAVVRGGGEEEAVLEVRDEPPDQLGLLGVDGVHLLGRGGCHVVGLVED
ncbi:hypothetical protein M2155_001965 [Streptomyces sp. SAI-119]|nr:hypothetical protein [Streptomyces sp. SAI-119]